MIKLSTLILRKKDSVTLNVGADKMYINIMLFESPKAAYADLEKSYRVWFPESGFLVTVGGLQDIGYVDIVNEYNPANMELELYKAMNVVADKSGIPKVGVESYEITVAIMGTAGAAQIVY